LGRAKEILAQAEFLSDFSRIFEDCWILEWPDGT